MNKYVIITDSSCDLPYELTQKMNIEVLPLSYMFDNTTYKNHLDESDMSFSDFYGMLRQGKTAKTSAVNTSDFIAKMEPLITEGNDILYLGFSSALSGTFSAGAAAARELSQKYPERKLYAVDTLCASLGQGLLVYLCSLEKEKGKSIDEVKDYAEQQKLHLCHWFTVDNLHFLKRGGRISATTAVIGTMLSIKPVLHMDNNGKLVGVDNVRGRRAALKALVKKMCDSAIEPASQTVFICHGDCYDEAKAVGDMITEAMGTKSIIINYVGPVIGSHTGPGVISIFFLGKER